MTQVMMRKPYFMIMDVNNMKLIKYTLITLLALSITSQALASKFDTIPTCPSVDKILEQAARGTGKIRCTSNLCTYDLNYPIHVGSWWSDEYWDFFMDYTANSAIEAASKAKDALNSLVYNSGPSLVSEPLYTYFCHYTSSTDCQLEVTAILY